MHQKPQIQFALKQIFSKQSAGGKSQEDKQLKFSPRLDKFY